MAANTKYPGESDDQFAARQMLTNTPLIGGLMGRTMDRFAAPAAASGVAEQLPAPAPDAAPPIDRQLFEMAMQRMQSGGGQSQGIGQIIREVAGAMPSTSTMSIGPKQGNFINPRTGRVTSNHDPFAVFVERRQRQPPMIPQQNQGAIAALASDVARSQRGGLGESLGLLEAAQRQQQFQATQAREPLQRSADLATLGQALATLGESIGDQNLVDQARELARNAISGLSSTERDQIERDQVDLDVIPQADRFREALRETRPRGRNLYNAFAKGRPGTAMHARRIRELAEEYRKNGFSEFDIRRIIGEEFAEDNHLLDALR